MPSFGPQFQFAAEFATFLVVAAGLALVMLRADLLSRPGWARWTLATGFFSLGTAAFLHGSLVLQDATHPLVAGMRGAGIVALAIGSLKWRAPANARYSLWAGLLLFAAALGLSFTDASTAHDATLAAGALGVGAALLAASRRSIAARVAASAGATLLTLVLVLSVALSALLSSTVRDEALGRLASRAGTEASLVQDTTRAANAAAQLVARVLREQRSDELLALSRTPQYSPAIESELVPLLSAQLLQGFRLAYVNQDGAVLAAAGFDTPATLTRLAGDRVVREAIDTGTNRVAVVVVGQTAFSVAASPLSSRLPEGGLRPLGVALAASMLDDAYLVGRAKDDRDLALALVTHTVIVSTAGRQPPADVVRRLGRRAIEEGGTVTATAGARFASAEPVLNADDTPVMALVASTATTLVDDTRESLFRTLFLIALGGTLLALLLAAVVADRIGAGLRVLTSAAEGIQRGETGVRAEIGSEDEVGVLGAAFDSMVASIEEKTTALRDAADDETRLRNRLEAIVAGMGEALVAVDATGRITDFNRAAEELVGVTARSAVGRTADHVIKAVTEEEGANLSPRLRRPTPTRWAALANLTQADGTIVPVAVSAGALRGPGNELVGGVVVLRDLRREREVERMKSEFLSRVGHELRTPLTGIMGMAKILSRRALPPEQVRDWHEQILELGQQLLRIIEMLEFFASSGAGRAMLRPEQVSVRSVIDEVVARWSDRLDDGHALSRRVARAVPDVRADRRWLVASIDELVSNAVKFSPDGGRITVSARGAEDGTAKTVEISVADQGKGMTPEEQERAFGDFVQGDTSDTRQFGGLGLGLSLVKRVAEGHGGQVSCSSEPGKGSKFSIVLPAMPNERV